VQVLPLRTPTLPPATHTNAYLVGRTRRVLVEPASPYDDEIDRALEWLTRSGADRTIEALVLTHHHVDHVGGAMALRARLGVPIWAHAATCDRLAGAVEVDRVLVDGERIDLGDVALEALHTPGHAPGHLCFLETQSGAMIAGDMVASVGTILIEPSDGDMRAYLASLARMAERRPSVLLPAHGAPILDPATKLADYRRHRLWREAQIVDALAVRGEASAAELVPTVYADAPEKVWPLAALSIEAHLIKLAGDGVVEAIDGGRWVRS
jgi:glyoxylase-like metal-dependent hydrolase (beta-lactamase superfamily II)